MGRYSTSFRRAPVKIGRAQLRETSKELALGAERLSRAAGDYGQREARYASIPIQLKIARNGPNPNAPRDQQHTIPINRNRRKRGFPTIPAATARLTPGE